MHNTETAARKIFGARASKYTTSASHTDPQALAQLIALCAPDASCEALDIATGTGHTAFAFAPHVRSVIGIDLTPEMLAEARHLQAARAIANVDFRIADVHQLPFRDASFDLITCRRAAHHFSDLARALAEMRRVLCAGGRIVIDDRSVPEDDALDAVMNELDYYHDESHVREYRPSEWRQMLQAQGLEVDQIETYIKHRPLTSLTDGVSPENVRKIHHRLERLNSEQKKAMNLAMVADQLYLNHWYVMLAARKPG
ncbi:MAG: class I SAM-dependent methyltransferase [Chloroflexi bacterium]|nr:class I SAM-dependent methyltransferase [Chloroflexota bacterium]